MDFAGEAGEELLQPKAKVLQRTRYINTIGEICTREYNN